MIYCVIIVSLCLLMRTACCFFTPLQLNSWEDIGIHLKLLNIIRQKQRITSLLLSLGDVELGKIWVSHSLVGRCQVGLRLFNFTCFPMPGLFWPNSFGIGDGWSWKDLGHTDESKQTEPFKQWFPQHLERNFSRTFRWVLPVDWWSIVTYLTRSRVKLELEIPLKFFVSLCFGSLTSTDRQPIWCRCEVVWQESPGICTCVCVNVCVSNNVLWFLLRYCDMSVTTTIREAPWNIVWACCRWNKGISVNVIKCMPKNVKIYVSHTNTTIHVWYIYLHLVDVYGKCR